MSQFFFLFSSFVVVIRSAGSCFLAGPISDTGIHSVHGFCRNLQCFIGFVYYLFARFSGFRASFVCSCYSILECYDLFSGVTLSVTYPGSEVPKPN